MVTKEEQVPVIHVRLTEDDRKIMAVLRKTLGVDASQIVRLAIRALATKEGVTA